MSSKTYAEIEKDLPTIVKAELSNMNDTQRKMFAEEFGKKQRTLFHSYGYLIIGSLHRWYLGKPWMTLVQWITIFAGGIGLIWVFIDLFLIPSMRREKNAEIAKGILAEQRILSGSGSNHANSGSQTTIVNVGSNKET